MCEGVRGIFHFNASIAESEETLGTLDHPRVDLVVHRDVGTEDSLQVTAVRAQSIELDDPRQSIDGHSDSIKPVITGRSRTKR